MPVALRTRLTCHYCGKRSKFSNRDGPKFKCEHCLAVNFLDENGDITDVPVEAANPPQQYAQSIHGEDPFPSNSLFCSTCVKNQYLYTTALSQYLPDPEDPKYDQLEEALPAYKEQLEQRYPQCCAQCESRVKQQLQKTVYEAKGDNLRRMLQRSRERRISNRLGWRRLLVSLAGLIQLLSLIIQLLWHLLGARGSQERMNVRVSSCVKGEVLLAHCAAIPEGLMGLSLLMGLITLWWNPRWQHKLEGKEGRLTGLNKFYQVQVALLSLRFLTWVLITDAQSMSRYRPMLHCLSLVLTTIISAWAVTSIIQVQALVDWHQDPAPLISSNQFVPRANSMETPPASQGSDTRALFVGGLSRPSQPTYTAWRPPTPPIEDEDGMEWEPTATKFQPQPKALKVKRVQPNPFHGTLPAMPSKGIKLGNRPLPQPAKAIGIPPGFFDKTQKFGNVQVGNTRAPLADPKFFPQDSQADTGLENIFGKVLGLQDDVHTGTPPAHTSTPIANTDNAMQQQTLTRPTTWLPSNMLATGASIALVSTLGLWQASFSVGNGMGPYILYLAATVLATHLALEASKRNVGIDHQKLYFLLIEFAIILMFAVLRGGAEMPVAAVWDKLAQAMVSLLIVQEVYFAIMPEHVLSLPSAPVVPTASNNVMPSTQRILPPKHPLSLEDNIDDTPESTFINDSILSDRRDSLDSNESGTSIKTTSTASAWKTPRAERNNLDFNSSRNGFGVGSLALSDRGLTSGFGAGVVGPRTRRGYGGKTQAW